MKLLPTPKKLQLTGGYFAHKTIRVATQNLESRLVKAINKLPLSSGGADLKITIEEKQSESYILEIQENSIRLSAEGLAGAFYGIQTLRQIFTYEEIPCLYIEDRPDLSYRGFYHDVTRGRVPTVETIKMLIDQMAYYKMNSLQLYVEHTFAFQEITDVAERTGCLTAEEIRELDDYCYENFIEFIPSIATFGHLFELLQKPEYKQLCVLENYVPEYDVWVERMRHHTIDPVNPKSFGIITSMIDQYLPLFRSKRFNICCDETFDLSEGKHKGEDTQKLYIDFVLQLAEYLHRKGKTVMMWADILLKYPDAIDALPEGIEYLNWCYATDVNEPSMEVFEKLKKPQIVCPGTQSWAALCPNITHAEINICKMAELGYAHKAFGMLNTNWGDYGHPCSIGLCMYPMVLGGVKSWAVDTQLNDDFEKAINHLLFRQENGLSYLRRLSALQLPEAWSTLSCYYSNAHCKGKLPVPIPAEDVLANCRRGCQEFLLDLKNQNWINEGLREEMLISAEGMQLIAELFAKIAGYPIEQTVSVEKWLGRYKKKWLEESKQSEWNRIEELFCYVAKNYSGV